ncbi:MAG: TlyA family RNA methyltransferase [Lachnospiraceae bacterium]|jgi:23S rRNA (cytidine1920-2'-O)/16S rRNA (cytidine1409-2'-O)-methyltransferase|nr:TlyA family RNA methyltransferase [Lachnospiraceae bacterium]
MKTLPLLTRLLDEGYADDEKQSLALVMAGEVLVDDVPAASVHEKVAPTAAIRLRGENNNMRYATRAGEKLAAGLAHFGVSVAGMACLDIGAAGGGFTDCLLAHGAAKIYAVDVAYGLFDWRLRHDSRVVLLERTNARYLVESHIPEKVDFLTSDVSFISLKKILPAAAKLLAPTGLFLVLYKPQFELPRSYVGKNGHIKNPDHITEGIADMTTFLASHGLNVLGSAPSPLAGSKGNVEHLLYGQRSTSP